MCKIDEQLIKALAVIKPHQTIKVGNNTVVERTSTGIYVFLHGNLIVNYDVDRMLDKYFRFCLCGYNTAVTRRRINTVMQWRLGSYMNKIVCRNGSPYLYTSEECGKFGVHDIVQLRIAEGKNDYVSA